MINVAPLMLPKEKATSAVFEYLSYNRDCDAHFKKKFLLVVEIKIGILI